MSMCIGLTHTCAYKRLKPLSKWLGRTISEAMKKMYSIVTKLETIVQGMSRFKSQETAGC